jgi:UDP-2-acetamido-3-amino-2,3-dideoxy-glucuronate N-acetyltransferase
MLKKIKREMLSLLKINANISKDNVVIALSAKVESDVIIHNDVIIDENVFLGRNVRIYPGVRIGKGSRIEDGCIIGYPNITKRRKEETPESYFTIIGEDVLVRNHCTLYQGSTFADKVMINHNVLIREDVEISTQTSVGNNVIIEGCVKIGSKCSLQSFTFIAPNSEIEDFVFIGPGVVSANDPIMTYKRPQIEVVYKGITIKFGARIGAGAILLPGIVIGKEAVVAAGTLVLKNVPDYNICLGVPGRLIGKVSEEEFLI